MGATHPNLEFEKQLIDESLHFGATTTTTYRH